MRISGTFVYQPQTTIHNRYPVVGSGEVYPCAVAVGLVVLNEDGSPVFPTGTNPYVTCSVVLSMPFVSFEHQPQPGLDLAQVGTVEVVNDGFGYVQLTYYLPSSYVDNLPAGWTPLAILATVNLENDALFTAAPTPAADMGILPPVRSGTTGGEGTQD